MTDTVSIIIPAYNAASRIRACLESVISQEYVDIEIIVVDDASSDGTGEIAREILGASDRKHKVITHERNRGECASRNTGMGNADGKYICFVDADDIIRVNFVSRLHETITQGKHDIAFCGLTDRFSDGRPDKNMHSVHGAPYVSSGENFLLNNCVPPVWCCMYDAGLMKTHHLMFHEGCTAGGDIEFIMKALCAAGSVTFTEECLYIYMHHEDMGSVRDNDTRDKRTLRYGHNTQAHYRTAEYLATHSASERVKELAGKILMPQSVIRRFNLAAMKHDRAEYISLLNDRPAMKILRRALCFYTLRKKPEVFMKALAVMLMPGIYYSMRAREWR